MTHARKEWDRVEFGDLLGRAPVIAVHRESNPEFIGRSGRIPVPLQVVNN
jgi:uncharacterized protein (UPF0210 family)